MFGTLTNSRRHSLQMTGHPRISEMELERCISEVCLYIKLPHQRLAYIISTCSLKIVGIHKESRICILKFLDIIRASFTEDI
jgi:hypothetical protein